MTYVFVYGSIQMDVPVNPVWPNDPIGKSSPRLDEKAESMSHPRPRRLTASGGCCGRVALITVSDFRNCLRCGLALIASMSAWAYFARSAAVEKRPACPATPPMRRAVGSCTTPRSIWLFSSYSVGAMRFRHDDGGRNRVFFIPSG